MADLTALLSDLDAESEVVESLVRDLSDVEWLRDTPAEGWTIAHQIAHLAWTDDVAILAASDVEQFMTAVGAAVTNLDTFVDEAAAQGAALPKDELLAKWRTGRQRLAEALTAVPDGARVPWFGPPMAPPSMVTARLMETWAHGQDIADALGVTREPTARLKHVAHIGVRARNFAYSAHGLPAPDEEFRVELSAPDGQTWTWGPEDATQRVTGPALDFCLLVTQRRHRDDLAVTAEGEVAEQWLGIAQAFAGPPGNGRKPGQFDTAEGAGK